MISRDRLARLHLINTLFHSLTGHDLYLASQLLEAVEAAQKTGLLDDSDQADAFSDTLANLHEQLTGTVPDAGFTFLDCAAEGSPGPLWLRERLLRSLRKHATADQATVLVANIDSGTPATLPNKRRRSKDHFRQHSETVTHLRELAAKRANPKSIVTLLVV
jgi:hypothetical protein